MLEGGAIAFSISYTLLIDINWNHLSEEHYDNKYQEVLKAIHSIFCYFLIPIYFIKVVPPVEIYPMEVYIKLLLQKEIKECYKNVYLSIADKRKELCERNLKMLHIIALLSTIQPIRRHALEEHFYKMEKSSKY